MSDPHDLTATSSPEEPAVPSTAAGEADAPSAPQDATEPVEAAPNGDSPDPAAPATDTESKTGTAQQAASEHDAEQAVAPPDPEAETVETSPAESTSDAAAEPAEVAAVQDGSAELASKPVAAKDDAAPAATDSPETATGEAGEAHAAAEPESSAAADSDPSSAAQAAPEAAEDAPPEPPSPELQKIIDAAAAGERVKGTVIGWNKGGFHITLNGIPAFCPKSQIELGKPRRANSYVDRTFPLAIIEIREQGKRIVVSRRKPLEEDRAATLERLQAAVKSGETVEGTVRSITDFGVFVELGGIEGLVHNSQLTHKRFERANEIVQEGQPVETKVLKIEKGGERISLSMKALEPNPWLEAADRITVGEQIEATVVRRTDFGLFMDVGSGVEGLLHESNLPPGGKLEDESYQDGSTHTVWVRDIDPHRERLSLSFKEVAKGNPWANLHERYTEGDQIEGEVEQIAKFGIFILLEPGLTGLLPFSALNLPAGARPQRLYAPGQTVKLQIDSIDTKRRRLSLAPLGSKLEGTKSDLKNYLSQQKSESTGLNAMAQAFAKMRQD